MSKKPDLHLVPKVKPVLPQELHKLREAILTIPDADGVPGKVFAPAVDCLCQCSVGHGDLRLFVNAWLQKHWNGLDRRPLNEPMPDSQLARWFLLCVIYLSLCDRALNSAVDVELGTALEKYYGLERAVN